METTVSLGRSTPQAVTAKGNKGTLCLTLLPWVVVTVRGELTVVLCQCHTVDHRVREVSPPQAACWAKATTRGIDTALLKNNTVPTANNKLRLQDAAHNPLSWGLVIFLIYFMYPPFPFYKKYDKSPPFVEKAYPCSSQYIVFVSATSQCSCTVQTSQYVITYYTLFYLSNS